MANTDINADINPQIYAPCDCLEINTQINLNQLRESNIIMFGFTFSETIQALIDSHEKNNSKIDALEREIYKLERKIYESEINW